MRVATERHQQAAADCELPFSSLFVGMRVATYQGQICGRDSLSLSVPFSSGCALQLRSGYSGRTDYALLSVPFSSGCALQLQYISSTNGHIEHLSVPFSSGCALQHARYAQRAHSVVRAFQFPFRRDARCNGIAAYSVYHHSLLFQFPFRRDARCNSGNRVAKLQLLIWTFSSLFVGMRVATTPAGGSHSGPRVLSVPFSSGCALQLSDGCHGWGSSGSLSVPFSSGCALQLWRDDHSWLTFVPTFSSLFVGMRVATQHPLVQEIGPHAFQFPFRRDARCNYLLAQAMRKYLDSFSSLFVGMRVATPAA